ncbi:MAG: EcsC family protein [Candidatus Riflebacteria bacterium]|nr:EcsC family protein [Candidatus Riflebacteria bacterium]
MEKSVYEKEALIEIHEWKNPRITWFDSALEKINYPLAKAGELVLDAPLIGDVLQKTVKGIIEIASDVAHFSVRPDSIYTEFSSRGVQKVRKLEDIYNLDLCEVDKAIGFLAAKYKGLALAEGVTTGAAGLPGIPVDICALITLNLRAIGEYATYCGFDITTQHERLFAMNVLSFSSSPTDASKQVAMSQLVKIAEEVAKKRAWNELEKSAFVKIIQAIAKAIGVRLTKAKLAQIIPVAGAIIGGGFNSYFTSKVCDAAYFLYRERFLARKYGVEIIDEAVKPAEDFKTGYNEEGI